MKNRGIAMGVLAFAVFLGSGCTSTGSDQEGDGVTDGAGGGTVVGGSGSGAETSRLDGGGAWAGNPINDPDSPLYNRTIYFDYDLSEIRSEYLDTLRAHADYLSANRGITITIEGHCDERGSREYNIALGERRANAVRRYLEAEGVSPAQIDTISYGEERPADPGHNEAAWALNRRAVIVY